MLQKNNRRMPDVLDCLANLSNDEVFTPPEIANRMLDLLPEEVFQSKETTFLDPFTKSGVFLREITKRLLKNQIPDYEVVSNEIDIIEKTAIQEAIKNNELNLNDTDYNEKAKKIGRVAVETHEKAEFYINFEEKLQNELNRILKTQVFGIAITELTAQLARRSLYCSKDASGKYSVSTEFKNQDGNIRFEPTKHAWNGNNCIHCGASKNMFDRPDDFEQHAYEFIHNEKIEEVLNMKFDVICGNPPYQLQTAKSGGQAIPIYQNFIEQAKRLDSQYITMIIPSRWFTGGIGLDKFRKKMMEDKSIKTIVDFEDATKIFPGVNIDSGVCYFLMDKKHKGKTHYVLHTFNGEIIENDRYLKSNLSEVIIRDYRQISILEKIKDKDFSSFSNIVSTMMPFGFDKSLFNHPENYPNANLQENYFKNSCRVYGVKGIKGGAKRVSGYVDLNSIKTNLDINKYKIFFTTSYSSNAVIPPEHILGDKFDICTGTFLNVGMFQTQEEQLNCDKYMHTTFFRSLLFFRRGSMQVTKSTFDYIPLQNFSLISDINWKAEITDIDKQLYSKYNLSQEEISFMKKLINNL